jgi:hypothetical protein
MGVGGQGQGQADGGGDGKTAADGGYNGASHPALQQQALATATSPRPVLKPGGAMGVVAMMAAASDSPRPLQSAALVRGPDSVVRRAKRDDRMQQIIARHEQRLRSSPDAGSAESVVPCTPPF